MFPTYEEYHYIKKLCESVEEDPISYGMFANRVSQLPGTEIEKDEDGHTLKLDKHRTLGVPRDEMPQLELRGDYIRWLNDHGIGVRRVVMSPNSLWEKNGEQYTAHAQDAMNLPKAYNIVKDDDLHEKKILLTKDGRIFDGNHHWLGLMGTKPNKPTVMYQINMDFEPLKEFTTKHYPKVEFEEE